MATITEAAVVSAPTIPTQWSDETSLADILKLREQGVDVRVAAELFQDALEHFEAVGHNLYRRTLLDATDARTRVHHPRENRIREMIMLASNNYLGLANHPRVVEAARRAAYEFGAGACSSPLLVGTFPLTRQFEADLAAFKGTGDSCLFASGYQALLGAISAVTNRHDTVVLDRLAHASMVDGAKLSGAQVKVFHHNDAEHLDHVLRRLPKTGNRLVCVEGIYSMDGDIAPLDEIVPVVRRHGAMLLVDEAHATGVIGPEGRGTAAHFGVENEVDIHAGTLSKSLGSCGGFVASSKALTQFVRYFARSGMFSAAPSPMVVAAAHAALEVLQDEPFRREVLWHNARHMHAALKRVGFTVSAEPSPIIPVIVGSMKALREMTLELHENNICVNSVPFPAVARGSERLRISLTANHNTAQLDRAVGCIARAGRHAGVIQPAASM